MIVLGDSAASQQTLFIVSDSPSNLILVEVTQMLCWGHNSPGGYKSWGQSGVCLTSLPKVGLNSLSEVGLSTLSL